MSCRTERRETKPELMPSQHQQRYLVRWCFCLRVSLNSYVTENPFKVKNHLVHCLNWRKTPAVYSKGCFKRLCVFTSSPSAHVVNITHAQRMFCLLLRISFNYPRLLLTCSLAPLSVDAGPVSLLLLEETQRSEGGRVSRVGAPRRVGGHPGKRAQLRRGRRRRAGPGTHACNTQPKIRHETISEGLFKRITECK